MKMFFPGFEAGNNIVWLACYQTYCLSLAKILSTYNIFPLPPSLLPSFLPLALPSTLPFFFTFLPSFLSQLQSPTLPKILTFPSCPHLGNAAFYFIPSSLNGVSLLLILCSLHISYIYIQIEISLFFFLSQNQKNYWSGTQNTLVLVLALLQT